MSSEYVNSIFSVRTDKCVGIYEKNWSLVPVSTSKFSLCYFFIKNLRKSK